MPRDTRGAVRRSTIALSLALAVGLGLVAPTAVAADAPVVAAEADGDRMTVEWTVPLDGTPSARSDTSSCTGTGTDTCVGETWETHCCSIEFTTTVNFGTVGTTTNRVTVDAGVSPGSIWEIHCDWYAVAGFCSLHEHGNVFVGDTVTHSGQAAIDPCALCDWTVTVENT